VAAEAVSGDYSSESSLRPGCTCCIPDSDDDFTGVVFTVFYYDENEGTTDNVIEIREFADENLERSIEGVIRHEAASMRPTRITVEACFKKVSPHYPIPVS